MPWVAVIQNAVKLEVEAERGHNLSVDTCNPVSVWTGKLQAGRAVVTERIAGFALRPVAVCMRIAGALLAFDGAAQVGDLAWRTRQAHDGVDVVGVETRIAFVSLIVSWARIPYSAVFDGQVLCQEKSRLGCKESFLV